MVLVAEKVQVNSETHAKVFSAASSDHLCDQLSGSLRDETSDEFSDLPCAQSVVLRLAPVGNNATRATLLDTARGTMAYGQRGAGRLKAWVWQR
jgi:hypothetical protein